MGCWRNVPAEESQCSNTMNQYARLIPSKEEKKMQSVSFSGLDWIKQRLLLGLIKFGSLFNMACLKICFLKLCPNTPCELPVPPFCPVLSPAQLCNVSCENCLHAIPSRHQPGCQRARAMLLFTSLWLFVNKSLWKLPVLWGINMKVFLLFLACFCFQSEQISKLSFFDSWLYENW